MKMIIKKNISNTLIRLDLLYYEALSSKNQNDATYFSKLALLECCGWIEESMDIIVYRSVKGKLKNERFKEMVASCIQSTSGFQYKNHFRKMLIRTIGMVQVEKIEDYLDGTRQLDILKSELKTLKKYRDDAAHTWISGTTKSYPAPSWTKASFLKVYPVLNNIYSKIIKM